MHKTYMTDTTTTEYAINTRTSLILYLCVCATMFMFVLFGSVSISEYIVTYKRYTTFIIIFLLFFWGGTFIVQLLMNISINKKNVSCSSDNSYSGHNPILITLMPWIFVLGIFMVLLFFIPGLLRIFSNTIGMSIVYDTFKSTINTQMEKGKTSITQDNLKEIYIKISTEPQLIINEMEYSNDDDFNEIYKNYSRAFPYVFIQNDNDEFKNKIKQLIISKNIMGYAIWIALVGTIASLISTNAIINVECG